MLTIHKNAEGSVLTVALEGRLDTTTAPDLEQNLKDSLANVTELVMDFAKLEYISSAGLRVLLSAENKKSKQRSMKLSFVNDRVIEIFGVTGFVDILTNE